MRTVILTIIVAMLATACSGVQRTQSTKGIDASFVELIDQTDRQVPEGEHPPQEMTTPQDAEPQPAEPDSPDSEDVDKELEPLKELMDGGNPQYASSDDAGETGADLGSLENAGDDIDYWGVVGC